VAILAAVLGFVSLLLPWWFFSAHLLWYTFDFKVYPGWFGGNLGELVQALNEITNKALEKGIFDQVLNALLLTLYLVGGGTIVVLVGACVGGKKGRAILIIGAVSSIIGIYSFYTTWTGNWAHTGLPISGSEEFSIFGQQLVRVDWNWSYGFFIAIFASALELLSIMVHPKKVELVRPLEAVISSAFHAIVGVIFLYVSLFSGVVLLNVTILGILSLITAHGLFEMKKWSIWLTVVLLFLGTSFGITTIYSGIISYGATHLITPLLTLYLILTWATSIYVFKKRGDFCR